MPKKIEKKSPQKNTNGHTVGAAARLKEFLKSQPEVIVDVKAPSGFVYRFAKVSKFAMLFADDIFRRRQPLQRARPGKSRSPGQQLSRRRYIADQDDQIRDRCSRSCNGAVERT